LAILAALAAILANPSSSSAAFALDKVAAVAAVDVMMDARNALRVLGIMLVTDTGSASSFLAIDRDDGVLKMLWLLLFETGTNPEADEARRRASEVTSILLLEKTIVLFELLDILRPYLDVIVDNYAT